MLFVTEQFLIFFIFVFLLFWAVPAFFRKYILLFASLFFYATWSVPFTFHLIMVVGVNYTVMELWRIYRSKWLFVTLQIANIINIAYFKYFYFFADMLGSLLGLEFLQEPFLRMEHRFLGEEILLPLAISFYTFQIMSYGIDIYRGTYDKRHSFQDVLLFKTFFPQLIAGPIMRASELLPQIESLGDSKVWKPDPEKIQRGLWLILAGVIKKLILVSEILAITGPVFAMDVPASQYSVATAWAMSLGSLVMLWADFSAYTDLARGFGLLMGFEIPRNFYAPFFVYTINEFWKRWHLTFSRWIRDYIFIPLGGSRVNEWRVYLNLIITFTIGGLWHGASYTFVFWGASMGILLSIESFFEKRKLLTADSPVALKILQGVFTWVFISMSASLFFAPDLEWSAETIGRMFLMIDTGGVETISATGLERFFWLIPLAVFFHGFDEHGSKIEFLRKYDHTLLPVASTLLIIVLTQVSASQQDFFYFQF